MTELANFFQTSLIYYLISLFRIQSVSFCFFFNLRRDRIEQLISSSKEKEGELWKLRASAPNKMQMV